jgi:hypothetical protein
MNVSEPHKAVVTLEDDDVNYRDARTKKAGLAAAGIGAAGLGAVALAGCSGDRSDGITEVDNTTDLNTVRRDDLAADRIHPDATLDGTHGLNSSNRGINTTGDITANDGIDTGSKMPTGAATAGIAGAAGAAALGVGALAAARGKGDANAQLPGTDRAAGAAVDPAYADDEFVTVRDPYAKVDLPVRPDADATTATLGATHSGAVDAVPSARRTPTVYERVVSAVQTVKDGGVGAKAEPSA